MVSKSEELASHSKLDEQARRIWLIQAWSFCTTICHLFGFIFNGCQRDYLRLNVNTRKQFLSVCDKILQVRDIINSELNSFSHETKE